MVGGKVPACSFLSPWVKPTAQPPQKQKMLSSRRRLSALRTGRLRFESAFRQETRQAHPRCPPLPAAARPAPTRGRLPPAKAVPTTVKKIRSSCKSRAKAGAGLPGQGEGVSPAAPQRAEQGPRVELPLDGLVRSVDWRRKTCERGPGGATCVLEGQLQHRVPACFVPTYPRGDRDLSILPEHPLGKPVSFAARGDPCLPEKLPNLL